nr:hypothetical protein [uncultured Rhodopila sp.]
MDRETLIGIVEKKHHFRVDPNDPVFVLATISEAMLEEAKGELRQVVADAMSQAAATEAEAQAKAEAIVTKAGEWAAERIREAGEAAATRILIDAREVQLQSAIAARRTRRATIAAVVCSLAALAAAFSTLVRLFAG